MKLAILSSNPELHSTRRLYQVAQERGHEVAIVDHLRCYMNITSRCPRLIYQGESLEDLDAVIPRIDSAHTFYGTAVVRQLEMMGVYALNESQAIARSRDKLRSLQLLSRKGIGLPVSGIAHSTKDVDGLMHCVGGAPLVIKLIEGTEGIGVVLAETELAARSVIEALRGLNANLLVQEFIAEAEGSSLRCFVLGDKVIATVLRKGMPGDFRSSGTRENNVQLMKLTPEERTTAVRATQATGLRVAGVDMLRSNHGPLVLEVNSSPELEEVEQVTGKDVAGLIVEYIEKNAKRGKTKDHIKA
jgi:ribosomal protein S6--L-glutamate ligase